MNVFIGITSIFAIPFNSNTFSDWSKTCQLTNSPKKQLHELSTRTWSDQICEPACVKQSSTHGVGRYSGLSPPPPWNSESCFPSTSIPLAPFKTSLKCLLSNTEISSTELTWYHQSQISFRLKGAAADNISLWFSSSFLSLNRRSFQRFWMTLGRSHVYSLKVGQ